MKKAHEMLSSLSSPSPAMASGDDGYLHLVGDKRYGLHGEILMLVLVLGFALFLVLLVALPCLNLSRRGRESGICSVLSQRRWCSFIRKKKTPTVDDDVDSASGGDGSSGGIGNVRGEQQ